MKDAIWATFLHKISTKKNPQHNFCDISWCNYLQAKENRTLKDYEHPSPLPQIVQDAIRPVYENLTSDDLLERCVGGFTQNNNESLNAVIWSIASKTKFCGKNSVDFAASVATSLFNDGHNAILSMMQQMHLIIGPNSHGLCSELDDQRIAKAETKTYASSKLARQKLYAERKSAEESFFEAEGDVYGPGIAD